MPKYLITVKETDSNEIIHKQFADYFVLQATVINTDEYKASLFSRSKTGHTFNPVGYLVWWIKVAGRLISNMLLPHVANKIVKEELAFLDEVATKVMEKESLKRPNTMFVRLAIGQKFSNN